MDNQGQSTSHQNRLAQESSPYLLQHAANPVDWYPWGEEALERARRANLPILLSVGYAACHWCHVMERESFEHTETAALMNERFVSIKVDREERPDIDDIYMQAVQLMTGHAGWPLTVFLTPELRPFYGGTYFPPDDRPGLPSFRRLLLSVSEAFRSQRSQVDDMAKQLHERMAAPPPHLGAVELLSADVVRRAASELLDRFDPATGGFGPAPKFPHPTSISLLLEVANQRQDKELLHAATFSLDQMATGGLYDHVGGGFHRYSTDARWLVPHFEKMLYDNALLAVSYLEAYQVIGHEALARVATETLDWTIADMQGSSGRGGYYSTIDADSEGVEGRFYVWSRADIDEALGDNAEAFATAYDVLEGGNWEGSTILNRPRAIAEVAGELELETAALETLLRESLAILRKLRDQRVRPGLDDKILTDWNGLMIAAMAKAYRVVGEPRFLDSALRAAGFIERFMFNADGRLLHTHRDGKSKLLAYSDDYANLLWAAIELYESTFDRRWLALARRLADGLIELFWDDEAGGFYLTGSDHEELLVRPKSGYDGATPPGNAVAAVALQRLATLTGVDTYRERARDTIYAFGPQLSRLPSRFPTLLRALRRHLEGGREIVVVGAPEEQGTAHAVRTLWRQFAPADVVLLVDPDEPGIDELERELPATAGKIDAAKGMARPTFFVCESYTCQAPTTNLEEVLAARKA